MSSNGDPAIEPVRRLKVADAIAAQLAQLITSGEYQPGAKLPPERVLSERFGVGRSSMREALRSLEADGLIRSDHGVGVFVEDQSKQRRKDSALLIAGDYTVPELFEVRLPLERDAAGLAARRITAEEIRDLQDILSASADSDLSDDEFIELDARLHRAIAEATKNALLVSVMRLMEPHFFSYSHAVMTLPDRRARAHLGHQRIVEAVVNGHVREARSAAVRHIREVEKDIVRRLGERMSDG